VKLSLRDAGGKEISSNFYWLPAKLSALAWDKTPDTAYTPIATFEDMTLLNRLPRVQLRASARLVPESPGPLVEVELHNPGKYLAFQARLAVEEKGRELLPVLWDDNYITLLPGESKILHASYLSSAKPGRDAVVRVDGWNFETITIPLAPKAQPAAPAKQ
jgi:exo-1,4-beta-D-glucosaminidase